MKELKVSDHLRTSVSRDLPSIYVYLYRLVADYRKKQVVFDSYLLWLQEGYNFVLDNPEDVRDAIAANKAISKLLATSPLFLFEFILEPQENYLWSETLEEKYPGTPSFQIKRDIGISDVHREALDLFAKMLWATIYAEVDYLTSVNSALNYRILKDDDEQHHPIHVLAFFGGHIPESELLIAEIVKNDAQFLKLKGGQISPNNFVYSEHGVYLPEDDPEEDDDKWETGFPLAFAALGNNPKILKTLIEAGADLNDSVRGLSFNRIGDSEDLAPLAAAFIYDRFKSISVLYNYSAHLSVDIVLGVLAQASTVVSKQIYLFIKLFIGKQKPVYDNFFFELSRWRGFEPIDSPDRRKMLLYIFQYVVSTGIVPLGLEYAKLRFMGLAGVYHETIINNLRLSSSLQTGLSGVVANYLMKTINELVRRYRVAERARSTASLLLPRGALLPALLIYNLMSFPAFYLLLVSQIAKQPDHPEKLHRLAFHYLLDLRTTDPGKIKTILTEDKIAYSQIQSRWKKELAISPHTMELTTADVVKDVAYFCDSYPEIFYAIQDLRDHKLVNPHRLATVLQSEDALNTANLYVLMHKHGLPDEVPEKFLDSRVPVEDVVKVSTLMVAKNILTSENVEQCLSRSQSIRGIYQALKEPKIDYESPQALFSAVMEDFKRNPVLAEKSAMTASSSRKRKKNSDVPDSKPGSILPTLSAVAGRKKRKPNDTEQFRPNKK